MYKIRILLDFFSKWKLQKYQTRIKIFSYAQQATGITHFKNTISALLVCMFIDTSEGEM